MSLLNRIYKYLSLIVAGVLASHCAFAQKVSPGGVPGAIIWYTTDTASAVHSFRSLIHGPDSLLTLRHNPPNLLLNNNPALVFGGRDTLSIPLGDSSLSSSSYFTVYKSATPTVEGMVWHVTKKNKTVLALTTTRVADLESVKYMNYKDLFPPYPKVSAYVQQKTRDSIFPLRQFWKIGFKPASPVLPVGFFNGLMPEIIAYKRALSAQERLQVASYLAIKYGITLSDPGATYLNSSGVIIWDGIAYHDYYNNIAGIARDDHSGLRQLSSSSSNRAGLLTVTAVDSLSNNNFILWGDNGKPLSQGKKQPGMPEFLQKKWLFSTHGNSRALSTEVVVDTRQIDAPLPVKPVYWLAIDRSAKGDFTSPGVEFIQMASIDNEGKAHFTGVYWGKNGNTKEFLALFIGNDLLLSTVITAPDCNNRQSGSLQVSIAGGQAPFQLTVSGPTGAPLSETFTDNLPHLVDGIGAGKYALSVTDAEQVTYKDAFVVNNIDGPAPLAVADSYFLPAGGALNIRADSGMVAGLSYTWQGPGGFQSQSADVRLSKPGSYTLTVDNSGCLCVKTVAVNGPPAGISDQNVLVYPNPSRGDYTADVTMDLPADMKVYVVGADGRQLDIKRGYGFANYRFTGSMGLPGTYVLEFVSGNKKVSRKLVVVY